jgi:hypothetical protein
MRDRPKDFAEVDVAAARINLEAAELVAALEARADDTRERIPTLGRGDDSGLAASDERRDRDREALAEMAAHVATIRSSAAELQRLASERLNDRDPLLDLW